MAAALRRAGASLGSAVGSAAAAAAAATARHERGGLAGGDGLLRSTLGGLRQLHEAATGLRGAGAPRGFASALPAEAEAQRGGGNGNAGGNGGGRPKPRFLLERLARAEGSGAGAQRGGGDGKASGGPNGHANGRPHPNRDGRPPRQGPGQQQQQQQRNKQQQQARGQQQPRGPQQQRQPGQPQGQQQQRQQGQQQQRQQGQQQGQQQQQPGRGRPSPPGNRSQPPRERPQQAQAPAWLQRERQQQAEAPAWLQREREARGRQDGGAPHRRGGQQGEEDADPPFQHRFEVPTEFPTAFPRAQQQQHQQQGGGGGRRPKKGSAAVAAQQAEQAGPPIDEVTIPEDVTVLRLAQILGVPVERVEAVLEELGEGAGSRQDVVAPDAAELAALEFGKIAVLARRGGRGGPLDADALPRPAVVTVMGHVDHGKTTLLDALRKTSVAAGEAGGITQHIGAFEVQMPGSQASLTFLDTPGHAAFTAMRARGAAATDLVVLVVAADDGVMPQTREAISHARAAGCPIVVAITKCDSERADPARVRGQLLAAGLELEEAGGSVQVVEVAAVTGAGLPELEEALLLQAELMELAASRSRRGEAVVIEARVDRGQGPVATVVVKRGTLKVGQPMVVGSQWGRVRALRGTGGKVVEEVLPGQPAEIAGLKGLPQAGDQLLVVDSEERAQLISRARTANAEAHRRAAIASMLAEQAGREGGGAAADGGDAAPQQRTLPLIIKADVQGSAEAVRDAVAHMATEAVRVQVVHVGVGPVSLSDVQLAAPLGAKVLGFNVRPAGGDVEAAAKREGVEVRCQRVIYQLLGDVGDLLVGASPRVEHEVVAGAAEVLQVFQLKGARGKDAGVVAGCRVSEGSIKADLRYRLLRGGQVVHTGPCASLKRHKLEVETVGKGTECGVLLEGYNDVRPGDVLQCIAIEMRVDDKVSAGEQNEWRL